MVRIKWHLHAKQVENKVDLYHDSNRDEARHIEIKKNIINNLDRIK